VQRAAIGAAPISGPVGRQCAVVEGRIGRTAARATPIILQTTVSITRAKTRTTSKTPKTMSLGPVIAQSAVIQSSAIHTPAAGGRSEPITTWSTDPDKNGVPKTRVARHDTIGNHGICGFAPQTAA